ncbi:MAG: hypothetical protein HKN43_04405 [Rhodothermales bacterium]|nr:hypothetical protein [Rhodothermales bacterium]
MTDSNAPVPSQPSSKHKRPWTILGRLSKAVREQNWFAVVLELTIVVFGVVIGFQVTAWGQTRADRAEEQDLLQGLRIEFTEVAADLEKQVEKHQRVEQAVAETIDIIANARQDGAPKTSVADTTLAWALIPTTTQFSQGVLDGMLATGRLQLIRDRVLRTALSEWEGVMADVTEDEVTAREMVVFQLEPLLWRLMDARSMREYELLLGTLSPSKLAAKSEITVDTELIGALSSRLYWQRHVIREFTGPQAEAVRILDLLDQSLE